MLKKIFSTFTLNLLLSICIYFSSFAQMSITNDDIQIPLKKLEASFYPILKKPIQSFVYIVDKDTVSKSNYSRFGNEEVRVSYENNKPFSKEINKYTGSLKTETKYLINTILQSKTTFRYDKNNNLVEWQRVKTVYDKTKSTSTLVNDVHWQIEFNKNKKVQKQFLIDAAMVKSLVFEYIYDADNRLVERNELQWKDKYEYKNGLTTKKYRIFKNDNSVYYSSAYTYNDQNLLVESSDNREINQYQYDSLRLKKIICTNKKDSTYQEIDLMYTNKLLSKIEIKTTDPIYQKPEFYFKSDYLYFSWTKKNANKLRMEFLYDKYDNVSEIKYFIKDVYKYSKLFIYHYY